MSKSFAAARGPQFALLGRPLGQSLETRQTGHVSLHSPRNGGVFGEEAKVRPSSNHVGWHSDVEEECLRLGMHRVLSTISALKADKRLSMGIAGALGRYPMPLVANDVVVSPSCEAKG